MLERLKTDVCRANLDLVKAGVVIETWGNASGVDRRRGLVVIKPSGLSYDRLRPGNLVVVSLASGKVVEGRLKPSSDTATHLELYKAFPGIGGVVHTHSLYATAWAQAKRDLPCYGTTHADFCYGGVPCTRPLTTAELHSDYEANTGRVIVERFKELDPLERPGVLVASHGPFVWGKDVVGAVHNAVVLEFVARLASETLCLNPHLKPVPIGLRDTHFLRKHGPNASYGQT
jgi:L-ribulose-5-phosphate 4-epimerase